MNLPAWVELLLSGSLRGALILGVAAVICFALRRAAAAVRHRVWAVAIAAAAIMPLATTTLPDVAVELPVGWLSAERAPRAHPIAATEGASSQALTDVSGEIASPASASSIGARARAAAGPIVATIYGLVTAVLFLRLATAGSGLVGMRRRSRVFQLAGDSHVARARSVEIRASERVATPVTFGFLRPLVLVPVDFHRWPSVARDAALRHELAHVHRGDWLLHVGARMVCCVYWFQPLVWLAARRLSLEAERACDDAVLGAGIEPTDYADQLLAWARCARAARPLALAIALIGRPQMSFRIQSILDDSQDRRPMTRIHNAAVVASISALALLAATIGVAAAAGPAGSSASTKEPGMGALAGPAESAASAQRQLPPLLRAAADGDAQRVAELIAQGADVNLALRGRMNIDGYRTALSNAARSGRLEVVRLLVEAGARVNRRTAGDPSPLMVAARAGHEDIVRYLLANDADAGANHPGDGTPLIAATRGGDLGIVRLLVEAGADVNDTAPGDGSPLIWAVDNADIDVIRYLLEQGADPKLHVPGDESPMVRAAERGNEQILRLLLDATQQR